LPLWEGVDVRRRSRFVLAVVSAVLLSLSFTGGVAVAQPPVKEQIREEFGEEIEDFCDVDGLMVRLDGVFESRVQWNPRKRDRLAYFMENVRVSSTVTVLPAEDR
jgi:hypothetical protein